MNSSAAARNGPDSSPGAANVPRGRYFHETWTNMEVRSRFTP